MRFTYAADFAPSDDGTELTSHMQFQPVGFMKLLAPLMGSMMGKQLEQVHQALRSKLERTPRAGAPYQRSDAPRLRRLDEPSGSVRPARSQHRGGRSRNEISANGLRSVQERAVGCLRLAVPHPHGSGVLREPQATPGVTPDVLLMRRTPRIWLPAPARGLPTPATLAWGVLPW